MLLCLLAVVVSGLFPVSARAQGTYGDVHPDTVVRARGPGVHGETQGEQLAVSADGRTLLVEAPSWSWSKVPFGKAFVWGKTDSGWVLQATLQLGVYPDGGSYYDSVALSADGQHVAIGDPHLSYLGPDPAQGGTVVTYSRAGDSWVQTGTLINPGHVNASFGASLAFSADGATLLVGAFGDGSLEPAAGAAWSYTRAADGWGAPIALSVPSQNGLGNAVAVSGDGQRAVVTNPGATVDGSPQVGDALAYDRTPSGGWALTDVLYNSQPYPYEEWGQSAAMSLDGSTIVIGAPFDAGTPHARVSVFRRTSTQWTPSATFSSHYSANYAFFGHAVAVSADGGVVAVGAPQRDSVTGYSSGGVYRYGYDGHSWRYLGPTYIRRAGQEEFDGEAVALSGDATTLFIGAPGMSRPGSSVIGAAYVLR